MMDGFTSGLSMVFDRLLDHSLEISVLIVLIFLLKWLAFKKLPPWWHYCIWLMLLVRMLVPIEFENRIHALNFVPSVVANAFHDAIAPVNVLETGVIDVPGELSLPAAPSAEIFEISQRSFDWGGIVPIIWFAGVLAFCLYITVKSVSFSISLRGKTVVSNRQIMYLLSDVKRRMKIKRNVRVVVTDRVNCPSLFGYFKPLLLLPEGMLDSLSHEDLAFAFMHELGHMKRHDIGVSWCAAFLQAVYWFNPFVWIAFHQMRIDQELACDATVLARIQPGRSAEYARAIVGFLEKFYRNHHLPALAGILESRIQMVRRITGIVGYQRPSRKKSFCAVFLLLFAGVAFFSFTGSVNRSRKQVPEDPVLGKTPLMTKSHPDVMKDNRGDSGGGEDVFVSGLSGGESALSTPLAGTPVLFTSNPETPNWNLQSDTTPYLSGDRTAVTAPAVKTMPQSKVSGVPEIAAGVLVDDSAGSDSVSLQASESKRSHDSLPAVSNKSTAEDGMDVLYDSHILLAEKNDREMDAGRGEMADEGGGATSKTTGSISRQAGLEATATEEFSDQKPDGKTEGRGTIPGHGSQGSEPRDSFRQPGGDKMTMASSGLQAGDDAARKVFMPSDVDSLPRAVRTYPPRYPYAAKRDNISGYIHVQFVVTKEGVAVGSKVTASEPDGVFDQAALEAMRAYRFEPGVKDGEAVDVLVNLPIKFNLS